MPVELNRVNRESEWVEAAGLVRAYADSLAFDLAFQDFDSEIRDLRAHYAAPAGAFLLARLGGEAVGCVGLRRWDGQICEMKRLYVLPTARGHAVGRALACAIMEIGAELGYERMRLDTVPSMQAARALYARLGFHEIPPYRHNPVEGTSFMECML